MVALTLCTESLEKKDERGDRKKKEEEVWKGEWEAEDLHRPNRQKGENATTVMEP